MELSTTERRHALAQLLEAEPATTNAQLATKFGVSTRTITQDRSKIRESEAGEGEADSPLAALKRDYQRNQDAVEQGKRSVRLGTRLYMDHCVTAVRLAFAYLASLQRVGVIPRSIGREEITRWDFVSPERGLASK